MMKDAGKVVAHGEELIEVISETEIRFEIGVDFTREMRRRQKLRLVFKHQQDT